MPYLLAAADDPRTQFALGRAALVAVTWLLAHCLRSQAGIPRRVHRLGMTREANKTGYSLFLHPWEDICKVALLKQCGHILC